MLILNLASCVLSRANLRTADYFRAASEYAHKTSNSSLEQESKAHEDG